MEVDLPYIGTLFLYSARGSRNTIFYCTAFFNIYLCRVGNKGILGQIKEK